MKISPERLEAELLQLPSHIRARLAETLIASLEEADSVLDVAWGEEAVGLCGGGRSRRR